MPKLQFAPPPVLVERDIVIPGLDARQDGLRIAHLTDIHVGRLTPRDHVRRAVELANQARPDVIALTGDYVCWKRSEARLIEDQLAGLEAPTVVCTLGNHDHFTAPRRITAALSAHGYQVLSNQHISVEVNGAPLHIVGIDDPVTRNHDIAAAFSEVPANGTRVVLCHCPEAADEISQHAAQVILSGHTHGGQIYIKGITDKIISRMGRRYRHGMYEVGKTQLYVGTGVGFSGVRVRVGPGTRAEVGLLVLRAG